MPDTDRPRHFKANGPFFFDATFDAPLPPGAYPVVELTGPNGGGSPTVLDTGSSGPENFQHPDLRFIRLAGNVPSTAAPEPTGSRALRCSGSSALHRRGSRSISPSRIWARTRRLSSSPRTLRRSRRSRSSSIWTDGHDLGGSHDTGVARARPACASLRRGGPLSRDVARVRC